MATSLWCQHRAARTSIPSSEHHHFTMYILFLCWTVGHDHVCVVYLLLHAAHILRVWYQPHHLDNHHINHHTQSRLEGTPSHSACLQDADTRSRQSHSQGPSSPSLRLWRQNSIRWLPSERTSTSLLRRHGRRLQHNEGMPRCAHPLSHALVRVISFAQSHARRLNFELRLELSNCTIDSVYMCLHVGQENLNQCVVMSTRVLTPHPRLHHCRM